LNFIYALCSNKKDIYAVLDLSNSEGNSSAKEVIQVVDVLKQKSATLKNLLDYLVPKVEQFCEEHGTDVDDARVLQFLKSTTVVGVLPVPHPIVIRKYEPNDYTSIWFTTYLWGVFFLRTKELPLWDNQKIRLFGVDIISS